MDFWCHLNVHLASGYKQTVTVRHWKWGGKSWNAAVCGCQTWTLRHLRHVYVTGHPQRFVIIIIGVGVWTILVLGVGRYSSVFGGIKYNIRLTFYDSGMYDWIHTVHRLALYIFCWKIILLFHFTLVSVLVLLDANSFTNVWYWVAWLVSFLP